MAVIIGRFGYDEREQHEMQACYKTWGHKAYNLDDAFNKLENQLLIGRYSVKPFYIDIEKSLSERNNKLINTFREHLYCSRIDMWYDDLKEYTPQTYFIDHSRPIESQVPKAEAYIVKGYINSLKAKDYHVVSADGYRGLKETIRVNMMDPLIASQGIVVRDYVRLKKLRQKLSQSEIIPNEWRAFFHKEKMLSFGFYYHTFRNMADIRPPLKAFELWDKVSKIVSKNASFYTIDISETDNGDWIVLELNDGQMSGISAIDPWSFYNSLYTHFVDLNITYESI